jgi:hypothetical protein
LTYIVIVRYEDSPVGPYDEFVAVSDGFANPYEKAQKGPTLGGASGMGAIAGVLFFNPSLSHPCSLI